jgi:phosphoribosylanthranilate isomerase
VSLARAREIVASVPPFVTVVALFVDAGAEAVNRVLDAVSIDLLQFHGDESPGACRAHGLPYLKALRMRPGADLAEVAAAYPDAAGLLVDAYRPGLPGGTGTTFDWDLLPAAPGRPLVLAGGLDSSNVAAAIARVRPWAVDVSGGVESAPGIKDAGLIHAFMQGVRDGDAHCRGGGRD